MQTINLKQFIFFLIFSIFLITSALSQRNQVPIGTRPTGMGDAFVSVANDGNGLYWNPAGIGALGHHELNSMTTNAFQIDLRHQFLSYIFPLSDDHALGFGWFSEGLFDDKELDWGWNIYQLTYGRQLFKKISFGLSLKYADNSIGLDGRNLDKSSGLGFDFGLLYPYRKFQFGLCLKDIGGLSVKHENGSKEKILEQAISLGFSYRTYFDILLAGAITFDDRIFLGAEYWGWKDLFALRGGLQRDIYDTPSPETIFSLGASLKYKIFQFDYAYTTHPTLRNSSRFSVSLAYSFSRSKIRIEDFNINNIFLSRFRDYDVLGIGSLIIENKEKGPIEATIDLSVPKLMDKPNQSTHRIRPDIKKDVKLTATFLKEKVFKISEDEKTKATLNISYTLTDEDNFDKNADAHIKFYIYAPGAVSWADGPVAAASFISSEDPIIKNFAENVLIKYNDIIADAEAQQSLIKAAILFDALGQLGIKYEPDKLSPFRDVIKKEKAVDNIRYPRHTLQRLNRFGDCDDLTVLVAAVFEVANIETAVAMSEGHLFLFFNGGIARSANKLLLDSTLYRIKENKVWIPVEATLIGKTLNEAIQAGSKNAVQKFAQVHGSWILYQPAFPPNTATWVIPPVKSEINSLFDVDKQFIEERGKGLLEAQLEKNPNNKYAMYQLGEFYREIGEYDAAEENLENLISLEKDNVEFRFKLGAIYTDHNKYNKAFEQAKILITEFSENCEGYLLNAYVFYKQQDFDNAMLYYNKTKELCPDSQLLREYNIPLWIERIKENY